MSVKSKNEQTLEKGNLSAALQALQRELPAVAIVTDANDIKHFSQGARYGKGQAAFVLRPASTTELRIALRICRTYSVSVLPQGGNTGLVGASTPDQSGEQVVISLERMTRVFALDTSNRSVTVSAGHRLSALNERLAKHGLFFPIDLGADPSIGGMIATNTGGSRFIRYGDVRANLLGLEIVLNNDEATILDLSSELRKDNSGPALKHLFVGGGPHFGIITEATLNLEYLPAQQATAMIAPVDADQIADIVCALEQKFGHTVTAVEAISKTAASLAFSHLPSIRNPFHPEEFPELALLVELSASFGPQELDLRSSLEAGLADLLENNLINNGVIGRGDEFWQLRHGLTEAARSAGNVIAFDVSVPRGSIAQFRTRAACLVHDMMPEAIVADFGHVADGGLHYNLVAPVTLNDSVGSERISRLRNAVYDLVVSDFHGSFSAEHGIGPYNIAFYDRFRPEMSKALDQKLLKAVTG